MRKVVLVTLCLVALVAGLWWLRAPGVRTSAVHPGGVSTSTAGDPAAASKLTNSVAKRAGVSTNALAYRLANTTNSIGQLSHKPHAILLANALIDTDLKLDLTIPAHLRSAGNPGAYIVQAKGVIDPAFREMLKRAGAHVVSYIPNNAYLVQMSEGGVGQLSANPLVQIVLPYEPYYKLQPRLLGLAVNQQPLPAGMSLNLGLFANGSADAEAELIKAGAKIISHDQSPFGPIVRVLAPENWTTLVQNPMLQTVEIAHDRVMANDLARVSMGISTNTLIGTSNYMNLTGLNTLVGLADSGVDTNHPDFSVIGSAAAPGSVPPTRVIGSSYLSMVDTNGHGTHVAGIIAGNGSKSNTVTNEPSGSVTNADFRGKAPNAWLYSLRMADHTDAELQQMAAVQTNLLICNNSWGYGGDYDYDLHAASYDAATRDSLPGVTGSQPVAYVFAAGNDGGGDLSGKEGSGDTVLSPGTAKNVITVGAVEQYRYITNIVTVVTGGTGTNAPTTNRYAYWQLRTDSSTQVADFSSRGNVGIGIEGDFGRFKPDVVAPGQMVVSTRSSEWDTNAYYNPTNIQTIAYTGQTVDTNALAYYPVSVPPNAVAVVIGVVANKRSIPFPTNIPVYAKLTPYPTTTNYDILTTKNGLAIPPDSGGVMTGISAVTANGGFTVAVGNNTNVLLNYDLYISIYTTNNLGDLYEVLQGMNNKMGGYYRYESGTSMAAPAVSGMLALVVDFFTNTLHTLPSPALMKGLLINGAQSIGNYELAITNGINFQGWGEAYLPGSLPLSTMTNVAVGANSPLFFVDQSPTNALATGDSHTFLLNLNTNSDAAFLNLQATLVWTDPAGDPSAAIKLVNDLDLIVTNLETGEVFYGNNISSDNGYTLPYETNAPFAAYQDNINNVEVIKIQPMLSGTYSVTVYARAVNVNAVTAHTNDVVQDYALVITCGQGEVPDAISTVVDQGLTLNPTGAQRVTDVTTTNSPLYNQFAGASSPLLGTNTVALGSNTMWGSNGLVTIGQTNQWHFYVVTNSGPQADFTNAAFITFNPYTASIPRMGVFADDVTNATRIEADIDMYVSQDSSLTNLNPTVISDCLAGVNNSHSSVQQGGTEFVYYTNSAPGQVYYIGIKSEDRMASEYAFLPIFTDVPFSQLDKNGNLIVNGQLLPMSIPDGNNAHPGETNIFALALPLIPNMQVAKVTVTNLNEHQNFGDLFGALSFGGRYVVLNSHDGLGNTYGGLPRVYDDSRNPVTSTIRSDGPGSLVNFRGKGAIGPWILSEMDNSFTQTGRVSTLTLLIQPHRKLENGITVTIPPGGWFIDYMDVGVGYTNLTFYATNLPPTVQPPVQMFEKVGNEPTLTDFDQEADLTNCLSGLYPTGPFPGADISVGPPLDMGRYFVGLYNPSTTEATVYLIATLGVDQSAQQSWTYTTTNPATALLDDAVTNASLYVPATQLVASVNVGMVVNHPRISDLAFTLVSPSGTRVLLMEDRGGTTTNIGHLGYITNAFGSQTAGGPSGGTNVLSPVPTSGTLLVKYDFGSLYPDVLDVYYDGVHIYNSGWLLNTGWLSIDYGPGNSTSITTIIDQGVAPDPLTSWNFTPYVVQKDVSYLTFTDDTNLAQVPIKFAIPPFDFKEPLSTNMMSDLELAKAGLYHGVTNVFDAYGGWTVPTNLVTISQIFNLTNGVFEMVTNVVLLTNNEVSVFTDSSVANNGSNYLALGYGTIQHSLSNFVSGRQYRVSFAYRGPGLTGWWRGEGNATDSAEPESAGNNGILVGRFNYPAGEVSQAYQFEDRGDQFGFAGTNTYIQVRQSTSMDVGPGGGFTIEGWINPTNVARPQPIAEWLAHVTTNAAVTNLVIVAGPYLNRDTSHYYYLLGATNWQQSEVWAESLGGHLATVNTANEQNWIFDNFASYGGTNHNLWIGLTNQSTPFRLGWVDGTTNVAYTNWLTGQPKDTAGNQPYTFIRGNTNNPSGLWVAADNNGFVFGLPNATNIVYGVVEVNELQTNGVRFWFSVTNSPGTTNLAVVNTNGALYANLVDTNFVSHEIWSGPGLIQTNVYQHIALTYNTNTGIAALYLDGTNVATTNLGVFVPKTDGDFLLGHDMSRLTNNYYGGKMDEMSVYARALTPAEIHAIYMVSALSTNRLVGKFDPSVTPALGLAEATVILGNQTNAIMGDNRHWQFYSKTFTATTNASLLLQITGLQPGILLDTLQVTEIPSGTLYYQPEAPLSVLQGEPANGNWQLEVWDSRVGAFLSNQTQLVSWQLTFVLQTNSLIAATLQPEASTSTTVLGGHTTYYQVPVPAWAQFATNILVSSSLPVDLLFNPTNVPSGVNAGGLTLLPGSTGGNGTPDIAVNLLSPWVGAQAGTNYYLGIRNNNTHAASAVLRVDFDILGLTNGLPYTSRLDTNDTVRYFAFDVSSNAYEATFQLLQLTNDADLVISKGSPLPTLTNSAYGGFNTTNADETIYVVTNSTPVSLSVGRWYLGVFKRSPAITADYTVLAKELDITNSVTNYTIVELTNGIPRNFTAGPGAALTNFFHFGVTNMIVNGLTNQAVRFELYSLSGDGDLTVQTNFPPLVAPFFQVSANSGRSEELIYIPTNAALTNLVGDWYLGVPNKEKVPISFTILAVLETNAYFPAFPGAAGAGGGASGGRFGDVYHVTTTSDSGPGSLRDAVNSAKTNRTVVFDVSGTITLTNVLVITNSNLTIAGQTAPGGGITVAGNMTQFKSAQNVVYRHVRFRRGAVDDSLMMTNVFQVIADHVSAEWSDTALSTLNSSNVTVQWSIMADSLMVTNNPAPLGSLLRYGNGSLSFHHNLYADNYSGSPQVGDNLTLDFVNNVVYNWGLYPGLSGGTNDLAYSTNGCTNQLNYVCNYLIAGPDTSLYGTNYSITNLAFFCGPTNGLAASWVFQTNNFIDSNTNGILDGGNTQWSMFTTNVTQFGRPFSVYSVPTDEAYMAYEKVLALAGVNMANRDGVDTSIVGKVRTQTGTIIANPALSGMVAWWKGESNALDSVGVNNGSWIGTTSYANGEVGQAFSFDGASYVSVPDAPDLHFTNAMTVEAWVYLNTFSGSGSSEIVSKIGGPNNNQAAYTFSIQQSTREPYFIVNAFDGSGNAGVVLSSIAIQTNQWIHLAGTYDGNAVKIYVNGQLAGTTPWTQGIFPGNNPLVIGCTLQNASVPTSFFNGLIDEVSVYKRALSTNEIAAIYNTSSVGKFPQTVSPYIFLDTDQDGIPDFWEQTLGTDRFAPSQNNDRDGDGYTDLEEYNNWLASPHALTITNTPVGVDLMQVFGKTGNLSFYVTNGINGFAYVTNVLNGVTNTVGFTNTFAIFNPTNDFGGGTNYGYASFDCFITNNDTLAFFGPVKVSVMVSAVPFIYNTNMPPVIVTLTNAVPFGNTNYYGSDYYKFTIGPNPLTALFSVTNATGPVILVARYGLPLPSLVNYDYISTNSWKTSENIIVLTNSLPMPLTNGDWYLAVVNVSGSNVSYNVTATVWYNVGVPIFTSPTNGVSFTNLETTLFTNQCVATDTNVPPLPLSFYLASGPTNMIVSPSGAISWTPTEFQGPSTNPISIAVSNGVYSVTNTFTIYVLESNLPPVFVSTNIPDMIAPAGDLFIFTNAAMDPDLPVNTLTYVLTGPTGAAIDTNGVITWTPSLAQANTTNLFTTVVSDYNPWAVNQQSFSITNSFNVMVPPLPLLTNNVIFTNVVAGGSITYYRIQVPTNANFATNLLLFANSLPVNLLFNQTNLPTGIGLGDATLLGNVTAGSSVLDLGSTPSLVPGAAYYLGVQNTNSTAVTVALTVNFHLQLVPPAAINIASIVYTNQAGSNGFLLTWFAPTNYLFRVQWETNLVPSHWNSFTNIVGYDLFITPTNSQFNYFDDGSQTGGFNGTRFYRLLLYDIILPPSTNILTFLAPSNVIAAVSSTVTVTNKAVDSNTNVLVTYSLMSAPPGATINSSNGIITWTATPAGLAARFTTRAADSGIPPALATNTFTVFVTPYPSVSTVTVTATNTALTWLAPTNDQFEVQWTTNLASPIWTVFPGIITSSTGTFTFTDTNGASLMKFYELILLP